MKTILLVGECGSGKTWVMLQLLKLLSCNELGKIGMFYYHKNSKRKIAVLGKYNGAKFQGSDQLSMAVMADADKFKTEAQFKLIIAEGDRFMNKTFIETFDPSIIKITDDGAKGRKLRGSDQSSRQLQAIKTRVGKVVAHYNVKDSNAALKVVKDIVEALKV